MLIGGNPIKVLPRLPNENDQMFSKRNIRKSFFICIYVRLEFVTKGWVFHSTFCGGNRRLPLCFRVPLCREFAKAQQVEATPLILGLVRACPLWADRFDGWRTSVCYTRQTLPNVYTYCRMGCLVCFSFEQKLIRLFCVRMMMVIHDEWRRENQLSLKMQDIVLDGYTCRGVWRFGTPWPFAFRTRWVCMVWCDQTLHFCTQSNFSAEPFCDRERETSRPIFSPNANSSCENICNYQPICITIQPRSGTRAVARAIRWPCAGHVTGAARVLRSVHGWIHPVVGSICRAFVLWIRFYFPGRWYSHSHFVGQK